MNFIVPIAGVLGAGAIWEETTMRAFLLGIALVGSCPALASDLPHFDFKGVKPTDTRAMHQANIDKCDRYFEADGCTLKDGKVAGVSVGRKLPLAKKRA